MDSNNWSRNILADVVAALKLVNSVVWQRNIISWVYVPIGIFLMLLGCFGVDSLISLSSISFPSSVACMIILFFGLIVCDSLIGERKTKKIISTVDIPAGFALRYINIFFTPSFVLLPLSPPISGIEVGKIIAIFLIGFIVMVVATAYMTRGLQLLLGSSKRAVTERAEEMGRENDAIPLTAIRETRQGPQTYQSSSPFSMTTADASSVTGELLPRSAATLVPPERTQNPIEIRGTVGLPISDFREEEQERMENVRQTPLPATRSQSWAAFVNTNFDVLVYAVLFLLVGLPTYYATGYAMPAQLTFNVLAYFAALALPAQWRQFLHPVLVSSAITVLAIWILGLIRGDGLDAVLGDYKTGIRYIQLWRIEKGLKRPGAGDVFGSILDASIVALALPMFQYRKELKQHFFSIVIPNVVVSICSLFGYPVLCYALGISSRRSLSFAARSLTLALATPAVNNIGGDVNTVAALCIMSGILGVLIGPRILQWLRIPDDDYVTRGVTLGGNSSAIATAVLLVSDPRAAALSSLSMSLFGTITVALTSIPPVAHAIRALVGFSMLEYYLWQPLIRKGGDCNYKAMDYRLDAHQKPGTSHIARILNLEAVLTSLARRQKSKTPTSCKNLKCHGFIRSLRDIIGTFTELSIEMKFLL